MGWLDGLVLKPLFLVYSTDYSPVIVIQFLEMDFFTFLFLTTLSGVVLLLILIFFSDGDLTLMFKEKIGTRLSKYWFINMKL